MKSLLRICFLAVFLLTPFLAMAESFTYSYQGVNFRCVVKGDKVSVVSFEQNVGRVIIPKEVQNKKGRTYIVTNVDLNTEVSNYKTNEIAIEKGIKYIDDYCFYNFKNLKILYIPTSIERFGKNAFNSKFFPALKMSSELAAKLNENDLRSGVVVTPYTAIAASAGMDMNYEDYGMDAPTKPKAKGKGSSVAVASTGITAGTSDVDYNIPTGKDTRDMTFCVIIANEDYEKTSKVNYARVDGETFKNYCLTTLGVPGDNVRMVTDGSYVDMQDQLDWLVNISSVYDNEAKYIVYYSGHGIPGEDGSCYMLPVNGDPNKESNGFSLKRLNEKLQQITASNANALVLMDACFSGTDRSDVSMFDGTKKGLVKAKKEKFGGNVVVMSAATDTQTSISYDEKGHGLFTYFLLKKLQETKGNVTYGDLFDYIQKQVGRRAIVSKGKKQTPSINVSDALYNTWRSMKF